MATIDDDTITSAPARKRAGGVQTISALPNYPVSTNANSGGPASMIKSAMSDDEINAYKAAASGNQGSHATSIADMPGMAPKNADAAYSQNGRSLGYGKTINGIATFSDGRSPGSIATMNPEMMQKLTASSAQPSNPNYGPEGGVTSAALGRGGLGGTLTQDQSLATRSIGSLPQGYDPSAAARNYQSDFASIVNKDPRSPLGIAARNAEVDRIWDRNTGPQQGHAGVVNRQLADEKYQRTIGGLDSLPRDVFNAESQAGIDSASNASRNSIASMEGLTSRNNAALNYNSRLAAAEARSNALGYAADSHADATRYAADARGNAARDVANTNAARPRIDATAQKRIGDILSKVGLSPEEKHQAISEYMNTLGQYGLQGGQSPAGNAVVTPSSGPAGDHQKPTADQFVTAMRKAGSKLSDDQLRQYHAQNYAN